MGSLAAKVQNIADVKQALKEKFYINNTTPFADFIKRMSKDETIKLGVIDSDGNFCQLDFLWDFTVSGEPEQVEKLYSFKFDPAAALNEAEIVSSGEDVFEKLQKISDTKLAIKEKFAIDDRVVFADYPETIVESSKVILGYVDRFKRFQPLTFDGDTGKISAEPETPHVYYTVEEKNPPLTITNIGSEDTALFMASGYIGGSGPRRAHIKADYLKSDGTSGRWYYTSDNQQNVSDKIILKPGEYCRFKYYDDGNPEYNDPGAYWQFYSEGSLLKVSGDISSMGRKLVSNSADATAGFCRYNHFFHGMSNLVSAKELILHPNPMSEAYRFLFYQCTSLVDAPDIPPPRSYHNTETHFNYGIYVWMFGGCTALKRIKVNFTEWPRKSDDDTSLLTGNWMWDVPPGGTFYKPEALEERFGPDYIPEGWTVENF